MDINAIIITAADAAHDAAKADRLGKGHADAKKAATQVIFECVKAANVEHGMKPGEFRVQFAIEAGYSCREYDVDGSFVEHEGEKMPKTAQTIISLCGKYQKEFGTLNGVANVTDLRNAFKVVKDDLDKALDAVGKLDGEQLEFFLIEMVKMAHAADVIENFKAEIAA